MSRIVIGIDHKWRDLPDRVYLGHQLERRGHEIFFTRNGFERGATLRHRADAVIVNHVYSQARQEDLPFLAALGVRNIVVPTEGMAMVSQLKKMIAGGFHSFEHVDLMTMWNDEMRSMALELKKLPADRIVMTGAPRFDFYQPPLDRLLKTRAQFAAAYGTNPAWPTVTLATNFTQADVATSPARMDAYLRDYLKMGLDKVLAHFRELPQMEYDTREFLLRAVRRFVREAKGINIILRPHPGENHVFYSDFAKDLTAIAADCRVALAIREYFWDVLAVTDVLVQRSCVTGYEAWHRGLPTLEIRINPKEWYASEDHDAGCDVIRDEASLLDRVRHYLDGGSIPPAQVEARAPRLHRQFGPLDGLAIERTAEAVHSRLADGPPARHRFSLGHAWSRMKYGLRTAGDFALSDLKTYGIRGHDKFGHFDRFIHFADVEAWREKFRTLAATPEAVPARQPSA